MDNNIPDLSTLTLLQLDELQKSLNIERERREQLMGENAALFERDAGSLSNAYLRQAARTYAPGTPGLEPFEVHLGDLASRELQRRQRSNGKK